MLFKEAIKQFFIWVKYYLISPEYCAKSLGVKVGKESKIETLYFGSEPFLIEIGDHVYVTSQVRFITHDGGVWVFYQEDPSFDVFGRIKIDSNTFIGNGCVIMPGVTIGKNCVIGGYSVVTKSIPDNTVAAGCPCRYICSTDEYKYRLQKFNAKTKTMDARQKRQILLSLNDQKLMHKEELTRNS
jgi:acetyltransferase-like isoleucine patch superfamily enzyme